MKNSENKKECSERIRSGAVFGRWTVVSDIPQMTPKRERKWLCRCSCGTERYVLERSLYSGSSLSCGCLRRERQRSAVAHDDLSGRVFGELTVLSLAEKQRNGCVWYTCRCSCGNLYDVPATLLVNGRRTRCGSRIHERNYAYCDITGQTFGRLTALYPTARKAAGNSKKGGRIWHCRCSCGSECDVSYKELRYGNRISCGCFRAEHGAKLGSYLTHINGTSIDSLRSKKKPSTNTSGAKGVYLIHGRYLAKIVFQGKAYYLGFYQRFEDAAAVRKEAERVIFDTVTDFYDRWKVIADAHPDWAAANPVQFHVEHETGQTLRIHCLPDLDCFPAL